jgi:hypothetical protein
MNPPPNTAPFDLEKALAGHPLTTLAGYTVEGFTRATNQGQSSYPYMARVSGIRQTFTPYGRWRNYGVPSTNDLFLLLPAREPVFSCGSAPWNKDAISRQSVFAKVRSRWNGRRLIPGGHAVEYPAEMVTALKAMQKESSGREEALDELRKRVDILSEDELDICLLLAKAWNAFTKLESLHPDEATEFRQAIHAAQRTMMARPVQRQFNSADQD